MEQEEERIWVKVRFWQRFTAEQAQFLRQLDELRDYVRTPDRAWFGTECWVGGERLSPSKTEQWLFQLTAGLTSHGPYCTDHQGEVAEIARRLKG